MEKKLVLFVAVLFLTAGVVRAEEMKADVKAGMDKVENAADESTEDAATEAKEMAAEGTDAAVEVNNKICPISGEAIVEGQGEKVTVNGKIYNVCKMGKAEFDKDPAAMAAKFADFDAKMAAEAAKAVPVVPAVAK